MGKKETEIVIVSAYDFVDTSSRLLSEERDMKHHTSPPPQTNKQQKRNIEKPCNSVHACRCSVGRSYAVRDKLLIFFFLPPLSPFFLSSNFAVFYNYNKEDEHGFPPNAGASSRDLVVRCVHLTWGGWWGRRKEGKQREVERRKERNGSHICITSFFFFSYIPPLLFLKVCGSRGVAQSNFKLSIVLPSRC